jgi:hypothetical protein
MSNVDIAVDVRILIVIFAKSFTVYDVDDTVKMKLLLLMGTSKVKMKVSDKIESGFRKYVIII